MCEGFTKKEIKKGKPNIAPLQLLTLATFRSWGIQQELVVPACRAANVMLLGSVGKLVLLICLTNPQSYY